MLVSSQGSAPRLLVGSPQGVAPRLYNSLTPPRTLVLGATSGKDARVSGSLTPLFRLMGLQQDGAPPVGGGGGPCEHGLQRAPVDVAWGRCARQLSEGREVVGVEDKLVRARACCHAWPPDKERHVDVFLIRASLPLDYAVLATVIAVVGGEHYVSVSQLPAAVELVDDSLHQVI